MMKHWQKGDIYGIIVLLLWLVFAFPLTDVHSQSWDINKQDQTEYVEGEAIIVDTNYNTITVWVVDDPKYYVYRAPWCTVTEETTISQGGGKATLVDIKVGSLVGMNYTTYINGKSLCLDIQVLTSLGASES